MTQKFTRGDLVHIVNDRDAIVMGSYSDKFGGGNTSSYTVLFVETGSECSWYDEDQLTFLRHAGEAEIQSLKAQRKAKDETESQLDWIVEHWDGEPSTASCEALMKAIGIDNPWGSHGEGLAWYMNWLRTEAVLVDALLTHDLNAVQERIATVRTMMRR